MTLFEVNTNILSTISQIYNRSENSLNEDVLQLKKWIKTQPHLPDFLDDKAIQNFLILNKCSIERCKESIDMYYTLRAKIPDLYESINPSLSNIKETMDINYWVPLPKMTKEMYRVSICKMRKKEMIDIMEPRDVVSVMMNMQELRLKEDVMFGDIIVFDMEGYTFGYLTKLTPAFLAKVFAIYEKVYSIPMKGMYVVNSPPFISTVLQILKSILKPKLFNRIYICEDTSILHKCLPKEIIPKDYGGDEKSLEEIQALLKQKLREYGKLFDQLDKLQVDESLRPEKLKNHEVLGFHGNFKKLSVD